MTLRRNAAFCMSLLVFALCGPLGFSAENETELRNVPYKSGETLSDYEKERCVLDVYLPENRKDFATLVWFHGGGLTGGNKDGQKALGQSLAKEGLAVVVPNYRLSPKVKYPEYIKDAAASVAWVYAHIAEHGGDPNRIFIGGHSAGGYLTLMVGLAPSYLEELKVPTTAIAGLIPVSGQTMTHFTVRAERGLGRFSVTADDGAPVRWVSKDTPPMLVIYAEHDMAARAEENLFLVALFKGVGHKQVTSQCIPDRDHGSVAGKMANEGDPGRVAMLEFIKSTGAKKE